MSIQLTQNTWIAGVLQTAGTALSLEASIEGQLVSDHKAIYTSTPVLNQADLDVRAKELAAMRLDNKYGAKTALRTPTSGGKCFYAFTDHTAITKAGATSGGVTMSTVSGYNGIDYDNSGSPTGSPQMVKLSGDGTVTGTTTYTIPSTAMTAVSTDGKMGLWIYADPRNPTAPSLNVSWSIQSTVTGEINTFWNSNQIRPGRNFLVIDTKQAAHPFGSGISYGTADLVANTLKCFRLEFSSMAGDTFYLDTAWTGFSQKPRICIGFDTADQDVIDYALPEFSARGWVSYVAEPCFVWASGSTRYDDFSTQGARSNRMAKLYAAGWDCCNHSTTHRSIGTLTNDYDIRYEIENARAWSYAYGRTRGQEFYVSPQSSTSVLAEKTIAACGILAQRHAKHRNIHRTPFGVDNLHSLGSFDMGNQTLAAIKAVLNTNIAYQADTFLFAHNIIDGGAADGSSATGNSLQFYRTQLRLLLDYVKELEASGVVEVSQGFSGWYYGNAQV